MTSDDNQPDVPMQNHESWFDIHDYGAVGGDVRADTTAFRAAVAAARAAGGGTVQLHAGNVIDFGLDAGQGHAALANDEANDETLGPSGTLHVPYEALSDTLAHLRAAGRTAIIYGQYLAPGQIIEVRYFTPTPPTPLTARQRLQRRLQRVWWRLLDLWPLQWKRRDNDNYDDDDEE